MAKAKTARPTLVITDKDGNEKEEPQKEEAPAPEVKEEPKEEPKKNGMLAYMGIPKRMQHGRVLLFGEPGVGKTTWGSKAPTPFFIDLDEGVKVLDDDVRTRVGDGYFDFWELRKDYPKEKKNNYELLCHVLDGFIENNMQEKFKTVVIDCLTQMTEFVEDHTTQIGYVQQGKEDRGSKQTHVSEAPWGVGISGTCTVKYFRVIMDKLKTIWKSGCNILILSHTEVSKANAPGEAGQKENAAKCRTLVRNMFDENVDAILFARFIDAVETKGKGTQAVKVGITTTSLRELVCEKKGTSFSKNRYNLPDVMDFDDDCAKQVWDRVMDI